MTTRALYHFGPLIKEGAKAAIENLKGFKKMATVLVTRTRQTKTTSLYFCQAFLSLDHIAFFIKLNELSDFPMC